jgi:hypothetical protein
VSGKDPVPIVQEAGWTPGPVRTGAENLAPTGIRSPDRPAPSQSLYRLSYLAHVQDMLHPKKQDTKPIVFYTLQDIMEHLREGLNFIFSKFDFSVFKTNPSKQKCTSFIKQCCA